MLRTSIQNHVMRSLSYGPLAVAQSYQAEPLSLTGGSLGSDWRHTRRPQAKQYWGREFLA